MSAQQTSTPLPTRKRPIRRSIQLNNDPTSILPYLEREDYIEIMKDLLVKHPEIIPDFKSNVIKRLPIKHAKKRPDNLLMTIYSDNLSDHLDFFPKQSDIDQMKREAEAFKIAGRPDLGLRKQMLAIGGYIKDDVKPGNFRDRTVPTMLSGFGDEIIRMVMSIDRNIYKEKVYRDVIVYADDTFKKLEGYEIWGNPLYKATKVVFRLLNELNGIVDVGEGSEEESDFNKFSGRMGYSLRKVHQFPTPFERKMNRYKRPKTNDGTGSSFMSDNGRRG
ncbi:unnamed protein product [Ambrosiozyma monospora]|uniref:Unnamed protein product n=1 Tax=Ambrosiozyma monospora TaxID=43982 RepID=A0A9W6YXG8_AMBMO|nr:unnamed protein product [Ambrosiozyma monospora]